MKIKDIKAREILDSRGNPTIECKLTLENGIYGVASIPSGASTGSREALELRDNDMSRYNGLGVLKAVANVNEVIRPNLVGVEATQSRVDSMLLKLDGTENKSKLGANAILSVSLACLKALAKLNKKELYAYVSDGKVNIPIPMMNIINGGKHADNNLDFQEFMIVPIVETFHERLRIASEVFHTLKKILKERKLSTGVGDEGGFAPELKSNEEAFELIMEAINKAGYKPGKDILLAMDAAASSMYNNGLYHLDNKDITKEELMNYYLDLIKKYPIISIEDPFEENDFAILKEFTEKVGKRIMVVGDDYFVTNKKYLTKGVEMQAGNAILLKANQIGTVTEMVETIILAKKHNYQTIISHRSGETMDTFISDLAVGLSLPYIKTGSLSRGERIAKYNRLLEIEDELR